MKNEEFATALNKELRIMNYELIWYRPLTSLTSLTSLTPET